MKTTTVVFITPEDEVDALDHELRQSHLLNEWPVVMWNVEEATPEEEAWYNEEYGDGVVIGEDIVKGYE